MRYDYLIIRDGRDEQIIRSLMDLLSDGWKILSVATISDQVHYLIEKSEEDTKL